VVVLAGLGLAALLSGCQAGRQAAPATPSPQDVAELLPAGVHVAEVTAARLTGRDREEILVAAIDTSSTVRHPVAVILATDSRGRYAPVFQRRLTGDQWDPIQVGRPAASAPLVAVFSARDGSAGTLSYLVVQSRGGVLQVTLERTGLFDGVVRFVSDGLLEERGDVSRIYRWTDAGWQPTDLGSQYIPPLPPETLTIPYFVNQVRGPMVDGPTQLRVRVGQHLFLQRTDTGEPSRILYTGNPAAYTVGPDGVVTLLQPDVLQIHIESPAYSGRELILSVRIDP
jgi:hypothetical protein